MELDRGFSRAWSGTGGLYVGRGSGVASRRAGQGSDGYDEAPARWRAPTRRLGTARRRERGELERVEGREAGAWLDLL
jgi:hypothetical protein